MLRRTICQPLLLRRIIADLQIEIIPRGFMRKVFLPGRALAIALALSPAVALAREPVFIAPEQSEALLILPDPPAEGSDAQKAELAMLHAIEAKRTPKEEEAARADAGDRDVFLFKPLFGDAFTEANLPLTAALMRRVMADADVNAGAAKHFFNRRRPYAADPTLRPACPATPKDDSYPSGHTTAGWLAALTLVEMVPEQREAILARAADYGRNRMVCGVHYPSDVEAGRALAYAIHGAMTQDPAYKAQLAAATAELRNALTLPQ
jgi:acid phosphatase (class A)